MNIHACIITIWHMVWCTLMAHAQARHEEATRATCHLLSTVHWGHSDLMPSLKRWKAWLALRGSTSRFQLEGNEEIPSRMGARGGNEVA